VLAESVQAATAPMGEGAGTARPGVRRSLQSRELVRPQHPSYVFHDYPRAGERAVYFHEFVRRAGEAVLSNTWAIRPRSMYALVPGRQVLQALPALSPLPPVDGRERTWTSCFKRTFRRSLVCHAGCRSSRSSG